MSFVTFSNVKKTNYFEIFENHAIRYTHFTSHYDYDRFKNYIPKKSSESNFFFQNQKHFLIIKYIFLLLIIFSLMKENRLFF